MAALAYEPCVWRWAPPTDIVSGVSIQPLEVTFYTTRFIVEEADVPPDAATPDTAFKIVVGTADPAIVSRHSVLWSVGNDSRTTEFDAAGGVINGAVDEAGQVLSVQITVDFSPTTDLEPVAKRFSRPIGANGLVFLFEAHTDIQGFFVDLKHYSKLGDYLVAELRARRDTVRIQQRREILKTQNNRLVSSGSTFYLVEQGNCAMLGNLA
jgi:hypothetical protein